MADRFYVTGTAVLFEAEVRDREGDLIDPTEIRLRLLPPSGPEVLPLVVARGVGLFDAEHTVAAQGRWHWRWESETPDAAREGSFDVSASAFPS